MFDRNNIANTLYGIVGLEQPFEPDYAILDADNLTSRSGYKANASNEYVKIKFLKSTDEYIKISDADFNERLKRTQQSAIIEVCNAVFNKPDFRQSNLLYQNAMNKVETNDLPDGFVCYKILPSIDNNIAFKINRVFLDFEGVGEITLQLYQSNDKTPMYSQTISITGSTQVENLGWIINNTNAHYKGEYYLGYIVNQNLKPFDRRYQLGNVKTLFKDLCIDERVFKNHSTNEIPDLTKDEGFSNYIGVNPDITVYDDYTNLIIQEELILAKAIDLQFQISLMRKYLGSSRSNLDERVAHDLFVNINRKIEGLKQDGVIHIYGMQPQLISEITKIKKHFKTLKEGFFGQGFSVSTIY